MQMETDQKEIPLNMICPSSEHLLALFPLSLHLPAECEVVTMAKSWESVFIKAPNN